MTYEDFVTLVEAMRHAQREYFRTKGNLMQCKYLEREVDKACKGFHDKQGRLFDEQGSVG